MPLYSAGAVAGFIEGERRVVVCGDTEIGIFRLSDGFYAWHNRCAHRAGPVCQGRVLKRVLEPVDAEGCTRAQAFDEATDHVICPWHGYEFDIRTGEHPGNPQVRLRQAELDVREGELYVSL